jgi:Putative viral replication protein
MVRPVSPVQNPARTRAHSQRSRRFCFTINNYTREHVENLRRIAETPEVTYLIFGKEVAPSTETPHLQGFIIFANGRSYNTVRGLLRGHVEAARGTSDQAATYCKKDGDFEEFGTPPAAAGKRTDIDSLVQWIDDFTAESGRPPSQKDVATLQPQAFLRYHRLVPELARLRAPPVTLRSGEPREWQIDLEEELGQDANDRTVKFIVDKVGGTGKSWFQGYYVSKFPSVCQLLGVGKRDDVAYAVDETKSIFFFNVPRKAMQFFQYQILEQLKDKVVFSTKYQSTTKLLTKTPHVVVFCNEDPDIDQMSEDRYDIVTL